MYQKMEGEPTQSYNCPSISHSKDDHMFAEPVRVILPGGAAVALRLATELSYFSVQTH